MTRASDDPSSAIGSLLGTAVGDAIGLPYEGLAPARAARMLGPPTRHRFIFAHGMVSDDTEHACMTAAALIESGGDPDVFTRSLARQLRWWLAALPGGTGLATARACCKLWLGVAPDRSGVRSAGNGPAMRAAILGATVDDDHRLRTLVTMSTRITHTDTRALDGAIIVALAARSARRASVVDPRAFANTLHAWGIPADDPFHQLINAAIESAVQEEPTVEFAHRIGFINGVSGFVVHTVPVALHAWLTHQRDLRGAIQACVQCGGDTDTTAAVAGGIVGAGVGPDGVPEEWLRSLWAWPRSVSWMRALARTAAHVGRDSNRATIPRFGWPIVPVRNLVFLLVVLAHGFRRLLPPY